MGRDADVVLELALSNYDERFVASMGVIFSS
jgi:hypothetical protein